MPDLQDGKTQTPPPFDLVQVVSAFFTGLLALTYVSGYLTAMSYLGTFDIPADASEFFRAKYLYIGFDFWLFVAVFGVLFYVGNSLMNAFKTSETREGDDGLILSELQLRLSSPGAAKEHWRALRWSVVIALITSVFSFELLFMRPENFRNFLPLQALFLLSLSLYQATFYKEYSKESYAWGLIHGRRMVRWIRVMYAIVTPAIFSALMVLESMRSVINSYHIAFVERFISVLTEFKTSDRFWYWADLYIAITLFVACFITLHTRHLVWLDEFLSDVVDSTEKSGRRGTLRRTIGCIFSISLIVLTFLEFDPTYKFLRNLQRAPRLGVFFLIYFALVLLLIYCLSELAYLLRWYLTWAAQYGVIGRILSRLAFGLFGWLFLVVTIRAAVLRFVKDAYDQNGFTATRLTGRVIDTVGFVGLACAYCYYAFWIVHHSDRRIEALVFGFLTLICALAVLTNILWLTWMHRVRFLAFELKSPAQPGSRWQAALRLIVPTTVLYLVSVLGFAHLLYPFIPVDKAGGDYYTTKPIHIILRDSSSECSSAALSKLVEGSEDSRASVLNISQGSDSNRTRHSPDFYILEENSDVFYIAPVDSGGGAQCWALGPFCGDANARKPFRPRVYQVSRACVAAIESSEVQAN